MLAGGESRRMGRDKALVEVDGKPMAALVADGLRAGGVDEVVLVGARPDVGERLGLVVVEDRWPGIGPLGGIASALAACADGAGAVAAAELVVVAACDQPDLPASLVARLITAVRDGSGGVVTAAPVTPDGRLHPVPAAWRTSAAEGAVRLVERGARRADAALGLGRLVAVPATQQEVADLDTPEQVEARVGAPRRLAPIPTSAEVDVDVPEIDIAEAAQRHAAGVPIVDVRQPEEYVEGHVPGAPLVPLATVPERLDAFPAAGEVLIICRSGARSMRAAEFLRAQGIAAVNIAGGTLAWIEAGHPVATGDEAGS